MEDRVLQLRAIQNEAFKLFVRKNKDYGDAFATFGVVGVLTRIQDKINRCVSITKSSITLVNDESLIDTLLDLHNYAAMAMMLMDESTSNPSPSSVIVNDGVSDWRISASPISPRSPNGVSCSKYVATPPQPP